MHVAAARVALVAVEFLGDWMDWLVLVAVAIGLAITARIVTILTRWLPARLEAIWQAEAREILQPGAEPIASDPQRPSWRLRCGRGHELGLLQAIPLLPLFAQPSTCPECDVPLSRRGAWLEWAAWLVLVALLARWGLGLAGAVSVSVAAPLIALAAIDLEHRLLPDEVVLPLLWAGLLLNLTDMGIAPLPEAVVGAVAGYLILWLPSKLYQWIRGREGMGHGDFKLLAALGACFGVGAVLPLVLLSSVAAAVIGVAQIMFRGAQLQSSLPFGPFLAGAGLVLLFAPAALGAFAA
jgi:leader peptidase (prepilin peptidase)/N-methyltransferase